MHRGVDEGLTMRILYVTPYPPVRDGIAAYAVQDVAALRRQGHDVEVLSPYPSAAHHHLDLRGPRGAAALGKRVRSYDKVIVQFHPDFFFPVSLTDGQRVATALALGAAFRLARVVEVIVHEVDYRMGEGTSAVARAMRQLWRSPDRIRLHTEDERDQFLKAFGIDPSRVVLLEHGRSFIRYTQHDRHSARASLALDTDATVFLSIGFIQPHKGFDRAVRAFRGLDERGAQLYVVGSLRVEDAAYVTYVEELQTLIRQTPGAHLVEGFVSDEMFDRWLVAADALVLPYRHIWSSGVLERAHLYHVPVIVTDVGGLRHQVAGRDDVTVVSNDAALRDAMLERAGVATAAEVAPWPTEGPDLMHDVQAAVETRAAQRRGGPVRGVALGSSLGGPGRASAPVRALHPLIPAAPNSHRPGVTTAKRVITRLVGWMVEPVYGQVNALRQSTIQALDAMDRPPRTSTTSDSSGDAAKDLTDALR